MKDYKKIESQYDIISKYIDEAISLVLKKQEHDCIRVLESLRFFSHSLFATNLMLNNDDEE